MPTVYFNHNIVHYKELTVHLIELPLNGVPMFFVVVGNPSDVQFSLARFEHHVDAVEYYLKAAERVKKIPHLVFGKVAPYDRYKQLGVFEDKNSWLFPGAEAFRTQQPSESVPAPPPPSPQVQSTTSSKDKPEKEVEDSEPIRDDCEYDSLTEDEKQGTHGRH